MSIDHKERAHAKLSASGATKWINCPRSPQLEELFDETETDYSKEGTIAHEYVEIEQRKYLGTIDMREYTEKLKQIKSSEYYKESMIDHVQTYVDYVMNLYEVSKKSKIRTEIHIEKRLDLGAYIPEGFGTSDNFMVCGSTLHVIDFKFGFNYVSAFDNAQLKIYAVGALEYLDWDFSITDVVLHVVQPRIGNISTYEIDVNRLALWAEDDLKRFARIANDPKQGDFKAGTHCQYCKASHSCKTLRDEALKGVQKHATKRPFKFELICDEEKAELFASLPMFKLWSDNFKRHMEAQSNKGKKFEGLKVVEGVSKRVVKDKKKLLDALEQNGVPEELLYTKKLISIGEIQKMMGKDFIEDHVFKPKGKRVLTTSDDRRKDYEDVMSIDDMFSEEI